MAMKAPQHPGTILREAILEGLGMTITGAAAGLGESRKRLSELVNERAGVSAEMAIRLEQGVGSTADHWLRLQMAFDLAAARKMQKRLKIKKLGPA